MKTKELSKENKFITQCQYINGGLWFTRFEFTDLETAQNDIKFAKASAKAHGIKYKYRLISQETITTEHQEED